MPKIKKTRKQKLLSDQRHHNDQPTNFYSLQQHADVVPSVLKATPNRTIITQDYQYVSKDLWKTLGLTGLIILAEILIRMYTNLA